MQDVGEFVLKTTRKERVTGRATDAVQILDAGCLRRFSTLPSFEARFLSSHRWSAFSYIGHWGKTVTGPVYRMVHVFARESWIKSQTV